MNNEDNIMNNLKIKKFLYNQTSLRILSFLSLHPGIVLSAREISKQTNSSKGATHQTLKILLNLNIVSRQPKGNMFLYKLNLDNFILKQFKVFENLLNLQNLIKKIQPFCYQVVLFGSCASGTNSQESDVDLFIKTEHKSKVRGLISEYGHRDFHINAIIQNPLEIIKAKKVDKAFFEQVKKGITLCEGKPEYEKF